MRPLWEIFDGGQADPGHPTWRRIKNFCVATKVVGIRSRLCLKGVRRE